MRIAFIGTHGTGKTTLTAPTAEHMGVPLIQERARTVARDWGYTPATIPPERLIEYQREVILQQVGAETAYHSCGFVSDRSVIDNLAYLRHLIGPRYEREPEQTNEYWWHQYQAMKRIPHYDLFIRVPVMFPLVDDGERHVDLDFQRAIDWQIDNLIQAFNVGQRVYTLKSEGVANRLAELTDMLSMYKVLDSGL